jgi:ribosomal protein L31
MGECEGGRVSGFKKQHGLRESHVQFLGSLLYVQVCESCHPYPGLVGDVRKLN